MALAISTEGSLAQSFYHYIHLSHLSGPASGRAQGGDDTAWAGYMRFMNLFVEII